MFALDSLVLDVVFPASARPAPAQLLEGIGGEAVAKTRTIVDADLDVPQVEMEISPTFPARRRGERRLLIVDEDTAPLRQNPRSEPIVARDLRKERDRLVKFVEKTGARFGRLNAFGSWGDAVLVVRSGRDLRALMLLGWMLDPQVDDSGRRRATPLSPKEFELKLSMFDRRLDELDDATVFGRVPPAKLFRRGPLDPNAPAGNDLYVISVLSETDGTWDLRKSYELEKRVAALDLFARIAGARQMVATSPSREDATPPRGTPSARSAPEAPEPEPARPPGPPIHAAELGGRLVLRIPAERFELDLTTALGKRQVDGLQPGDQLSGKQRDRIQRDGCGFVAPLGFLSEVFVDGKPLDRKRFETDAQPIEGGRMLDAHLPRFGAVRVLEVAGKRWITSEILADPRAILALVP